MHLSLQIFAIQALCIYEKCEAYIWYRLRILAVICVDALSWYFFVSSLEGTLENIANASKKQTSINLSSIIGTIPGTPQLQTL